MYSAAGVFLLLQVPIITNAQDITSGLQGMQPVLDNVYNEMIPLCSKLIDAARGIAGFAAFVVHRLKGMEADRTCRAAGLLSALAAVRIGHGSDAVPNGHFANEWCVAADCDGNRRNAEKLEQQYRLTIKAKTGCNKK